MPYSEIEKITLKDFTGFRRPNATLYGETEFAFIVTSIEWHVSDSEVEVKSLFHPARSYVFNENTFDKMLLTHELYHFRITEVAARRVRNELSQYKSTPSKTQVKEIIRRVRADENRMQAQYDHEAYHGYILKNQKAWQLKVDSLLSSLDNFSTTIIRYHK